MIPSYSTDIRRRGRTVNCDVTAKEPKGGLLISLPDIYLSTFTTIDYFGLTWAVGSTMDLLVILSIPRK
jgi:hypothetical protein